MKYSKKDIVRFSHPIFGVLRAVKNDRNPLFVAVDIGRILGYKDPRSVFHLVGPSGTYATDTVDHMKREYSMLSLRDVMYALSYCRRLERDLLHEWIRYVVSPKLMNGNRQRSHRYTNLRSDCCKVRPLTGKEKKMKQTCTEIIYLMENEMDAMEEVLQLREVYRNVYFLVDHYDEKVKIEIIKDEELL